VVVVVESEKNSFFVNDEQTAKGRWRIVAVVADMIANINVK
jgi:hypothetical protein